MPAIPHVGIDEIERRAGNKFTRKVFDAITAFLDEGIEVRVQGFGTFTPTVREPEKKRTPLAADGFSNIPRRRHVKFRLDVGLRKFWEEQLAKEFGEEPSQDAAPEDDDTDEEPRDE